MISVVIATYNGERFILKQLESILEQTVLPDEIIISDDCSEDQTPSIIEAFINRYSERYPSIAFQYNKNPINKGYVNNFLDMILKSKGQAVFLADQDDIWKKDKIQNMYADMKALQAKAIHSDIDIINAEGNLVRKKWQNYRFKKRINRGNRFLKKLNYCGMSMVFDGEYIRKWIPKVRGIDIPSHDWLICALADLDNAFVQIGSVYTYRRVHGNNAALNNLNTTYEGKCSERIELLNLYLNYYSIYLEILEVVCPENERKKKIVERMYKLTLKRIQCIERKSLLKLLGLLIHIYDYPTGKAFLGDAAYIMNLKEVIKKVRH